MIKEGQAIESVLKLYDVYVNRVEFFKSDSYDPSIDERDLKFQFDSEVYENDDEKLYKVVTTTKISGENSRDFKIILIMTGIFGVDNKADLEEGMKNFIIEKNTLTIMFPYIRSYITNLTAQSGIAPITLPLINIVSLLEKNKTKDRKKQG